jgi:hypothetical protein
LHLVTAREIAQLAENSTLLTNRVTYQHEDNPFGKTWEEWTAEWWKWSLSLPKDQNPITDTTGKNASYNQRGPVWFLAGTFGGLAERTCEIPAEKAIFFPISCNSTSYAECPNFKTEAELRAFAKADIDQVKTIMATVDGQRLPNSDLRRLESPPFELDLPEENVVGVSPGKTKSNSDGYWVFLRPLPVGKHEIHFFSSCRIGTQWIEARYHLTVR